LVTGEGAIYQSFTVGRVAFVMTDTRSERDAEAGPGGVGDSVLGSSQRQWLKQELLEASRTHALVVWVSAVPWIAPAGNRDDWGGYAAEREDIANFIAENQITNLVMLSGDAHMIALDDGTNSDFNTSGAGGFPVMHAGALDRPGSVKGGPYSGGTFPGPGQFGLIRIEDDGQTLRLAFSGRDWTGRELVSSQLDVPARPGH
jgi:hypothetical protein